GLNLAESIAPVQLAVRLLIPAQSKLLELPEIRERTGEFSERELRYRWTYEDQRVERLYRAVGRIVGSSQTEALSRSAAFAQVWDAAQRACQAPIQRAGKELVESRFLPRVFPARATIPYLTEPWFC
ncbi:MAG: CUAEP/CCAEP-tail radical SAM (seleno)protein, partial [Terriglobia bacterium]